MINSLIYCCNGGGGEWAPAKVSKTDNNDNENKETKKQHSFCVGESFKLGIAYDYL